MPKRMQFMAQWYRGLSYQDWLVAVAVLGMTNPSLGRDANNCCNWVILGWHNNWCNWVILRRHSNWYNWVINGNTRQWAIGATFTRSVPVSQCPTRALFQLSRRDREYLSFNLVSETGSRISFFQSHASRRDRDFLSFNLVLRDEHENFFLSISCFETSTRIFPSNIRLRDESEKFCHFVSVFETRTGFFLAFSKEFPTFFIFSLIIHKFGPSQ